MLLDVISFIRICVIRTMRVKTGKSVADLPGTAPMNPSPRVNLTIEGILHKMSSQQPLEDLWVFSLRLELNQKGVEENSVLLQGMGVLY